MPNRSAVEEPDDTLSGVMVALGLFVYTLAGVLTAVGEVLLVPLRFGATIAPVAVLLAVISNSVLPRLSRRISPDSFGAVVPVIGWLVGVFVLALGRPEGDVLLAGGSGDDALVGYALMVAGFVTGVGTVLRLASQALSRDRELRRNRP